MTHQKEEVKHSPNSDPTEDLELEMNPDDDGQLDISLLMPVLSRRQSATVKFLENKVLSSQAKDIEFNQ